MADKGLKSNVVGLFGGTMLGISSVPKAFAKLHPVHKTPSIATFTAGIGAAAFCTVMTLLSERVLTDTILSLGIMICFYYGLPAFGCIWFFRHQLFTSAFNFVFKFLFPLLGGLGLFFVLYHHAAGQRGSRVRQRGGHRRHRAGAHLGPRADPGRFDLHAHHASPTTGVLPWRDDQTRVGACDAPARASGVVMILRFMRAELVEAHDRSPSTSSGRMRQRRPAAS